MKNYLILFAICSFLLLSCDNNEKIMKEESSFIPNADSVRYNEKKNIRVSSGETFYNIENVDSIWEDHKTSVVTVIALDEEYIFNHTEDVTIAWY